MKIVLKFGGTSISTAKNIRQVASYIHSLSRQNQVVVVCSAIDGITDDLIHISKFIQRGNKEAVNKLIAKIISRHKQLANETIKKPQNRKKLLETLSSDLSELEELLHGVILLGEVTPRSLDYIVSFGERLSIKIIAHALLDLGRKSVPLTGGEAGIVTDSNFGESRPLMDTTRLRIIKNVDSLLSKKTVPVIGGFAGVDQYGNITTFGRGGSDYSATIIASA